MADSIPTISRNESIPMNIIHDTIIPEMTSVLLIGIHYDRDIIKEMKDRNLDNMSLCPGNTDRKLDKSVIRDTWRCNQIEELYAPYVKVHTCTVLDNELRQSDATTNINCCINGHQFLRQLLSCKWKFKEIYMDNFRMPDAYLRAKVTNNFIKNLINMAKTGHLIENDVVYLPFTPHIFNIVNSSANLVDHFVVTYLRKSELSESNHKLSFVTSSVEHSTELEILGKSVTEMEKNITFNMNEMLKLAPSPSLTEDTAQFILSELGHVEQIRYIVLTVCVKKGPTLPPILLINKTPISSYALSIGSIIACNNQLATTQITLPSNNPISELGRLILDKLILSKPNTPDGISIVADSPMNNPPQLNIKVRQVLRQFYGENSGFTNDRRILRPAY